MRLNTLKLERFGPFVGETLSFRREAKLHIVYGRNEAGKSCALAALTDLFFGIERQTKYDFLHEGRELRIGGVIADKTGRELRFRRRKGNKGTLLGFDSHTALPDDILARYLGSVTREVFCNAFGLNAQTLRSGAEEMLKSEGEVGATLFAAASGLRGLTDLRQQLETESNTIFASRASKDRAFYQSLDRFTLASKAIRERELKAGQWKDLNDKIDRLASELDEIKQKRQANGSEQAKLSRLRRVAPQTALIDADLSDLGALGDLPDIEAGFCNKLEAGLKARDDALQIRDRTLKEEQQTHANHASITFDEAPLARAKDIVQLFSELGAFTKAQADIPAVEREVHVFANQLVDLAARLGLPDAQTMENARPSDATLALIQALISEGSKLLTSISSNDTDLAEEQDALVELEHEAAVRGKAINPKPFADTLTALLPAFRQLDRRKELQANVAKQARQLAEAASRLKPFLPGSLDTLAVIELPALQTVARIQIALESIDKERDRLHDRVPKTTASIQGLEQRLLSLSTERPVPTRDAIIGKRAQRDSIWRGLRSTLLGEPNAIAPAAMPQSTIEFERNSADADRVSDEALVDASRVAEFASAERQMDDGRRTLAETYQNIKELDERRAKEWERYVALWAAAGVTAPLPPPEMSVWLDAVDKLLERREGLHDAQDKLRAVDAAIESAAPGLARLAAEIGLDELKGLDPAAIVPGVEIRLREMTDYWGQRRELEANLRGAKDRLAKLVRQQNQLGEKHHDWQVRWEPAVAAISVPGATIEQAQAGLAVWQTVPSTSRERADRAGRVAGMRADMAVFAAKIRTLVAEAAHDLVDLAPETALKQLNARLTDSTKSNTRLTEAAKHLDDAYRKRQNAENVLAEANNGLAHLASRLPPDADLPDLCHRLKIKDTLRASLAKLREQLLAQSDGLPEEELRAQIRGFNPDLANGTLTILELEAEQFDHSGKEVFAAHRQALAEREALEEGVGAELAAVQKRSAEAELAASAREWSVLKLGSLLLGVAIERQRTSQQDPLMLRAGQLFSTITGNSFSGLGQEFDDNDVPRLIGRRPGGGEVHVGGMSEGARDQLYLALRLAYMEDYAKRSEPIPFVGDDLFMTFDDDRTKNGLAALAGLSTGVQPILFTHHMHVVELAREALGNDVDVMELASTEHLKRRLSA